MADALTVPNLITRADKGSELNHAEVDNNFALLRQTLTAVFGLISGYANPDGTLKDNVVGTNPLLDRSVTQRKLALESAFSAQDTGAANQYQIDFTPTPAAYANGQFFIVKAANANTGASTLRVGVLAHTKILKQGSVELEAGDIADDSAFGVLYWGGAFHLISGSGGAGSGGSGFSGISKYEPADVALPGANTAATFTHGFGVQPAQVNVGLINVSTEHGFAVSEVLPIDSFYDGDGEPAFTVVMTASAIVVTQHTATIKVTRLSDGTPQSITVGNWRLVVTAYQTTTNSAGTFPDLNLQIANPDGAVSYGQLVFVWHHNRHDSELHHTLWNLQTGALTWVETYASEHFGINPATFRYTNGNDRAVFTSNDGTDGEIFQQLLQSPYTRTLLKTVAGDLTPHNFKPIWIDDAPGDANPTVFFAYSAYAAATNLTNAVACKKIVYSGGYGAFTTHGINLNLHHASIVDAAEFAKYHTAGAGILMFQYNPHNSKRRIYLISSGTGFIHIFNLLLNTTSNGTAGHASNANISAWWPTASGGAEATQMAMLTYEKALPLAGLGIGWANVGREKFCIEYDHSTGQELAIVMSRTGSADQCGSVVRVPWKE